jgi:hypothetical protein
LGRPASRASRSNQRENRSGWSGRPSPPGEDQPGVLPAGADDQPFLGLVGSVLPERRCGCRVERQRPLALGGLGLGNVHLIVDLDTWLARGHAAGRQVDVDPAKSGDLAAPHAGGGEQHPGCVQAVAAHVGQEGAELCGTPDLHLGRDDLGRVGCVGDVAGDVSPTHGVLEGRAQGSMDVLHRLGREARPSRSSRTRAWSAASTAEASSSASALPSTGWPATGSHANDGRPARALTTWR